MTVRLRSRYRGQALSGSDPFTDLLFNILLGFILLFFISIVFLNPADDSGKIDIEAEYVITITWEDNSPDDIDAWVEDPQGNVTFYKKRESGLVHLDRDDRGMLNDKITVNGKEIENPLNQEVLAIRGFMPGEYTVNLHYYESESNEPVDVAVKVSKVNPVYTVAYYGTTTMNEKDEEQTAVRFTILADGSIDNINQLPKQLVPR